MVFMEKIITEFKVICDETNNTAETISKNEVHASVVFKTRDFKANDLATIFHLFEDNLPQLIGRYECYRLMDKLK